MSKDSEDQTGQTFFPELQKPIQNITYGYYGATTLLSYMFGERTQKNGIWEKFKYHAETLIQNEGNTTKRFIIENSFLRPRLAAPLLIYAGLKLNQTEFLTTTQNHLNQLALQTELDRDLANYSAKIYSFDAFRTGFKSIGLLSACSSMLKMSIVLGPESYKDIAKFSTIAGLRGGLAGGLLLGAFHYKLTDILLTGAVEYSEHKENNPTEQVNEPQTTQMQADETRYK